MQTELGLVLATGVARSVLRDWLKGLGTRTFSLVDLWPLDTQPDEALKFGTSRRTWAVAFADRGSEYNFISTLQVSQSMIYKEYVYTLLSWLEVDEGKE